MDEQIEHKGYIIKIESDNFADSPDEWSDTGAFLVGFDHRNFWVERKGFGKEVVIAALNGGKDDPDAIEPDANAIEILKKYYVFPLEAYIHSGVSLHLAGGAKVDRQWDVSAVGAVFVEKKTEAKTRKAAEKIALGIIATWNQYLSGDVYHVSVEDQDGEIIDSCGGIYGYEDAKQSGIETADRIAGSDITPPFLKKDARKIFSDNFEKILSKCDDSERGTIGRALQKAINNL